MDHPAGLEDSGNNKVNRGAFGAIFLAAPCTRRPRP